MTRVSVGLPVRNGAEFIGAALEGLVAQRFEDLEIVISDNASTDATVAICEHFASNYRVVLHRLPENVGAVENFNRLVRLTAGELFMWATADDLFLPMYVAKCVEILDQRPELAGCSSWIQFIDQTGRPIGMRRPSLAVQSQHLRRRLRSYLRDMNEYLIFSVMRRDALLQTAALLRSEWGADILLAWELLLRRPMVVIPEPLIQYRRHRKREVEDVVADLRGTAGAKRKHLVSLSMWRHMWQIVDESAPPRARRIARQELLLSLGPEFLFSDARRAFGRELAATGSLRSMIVHLPKAALFAGLMLLLNPWRFVRRTIQSMNLWDQ